MLFILLYFIIHDVSSLENDCSLKGKRLIIIGDSTSRFEYEQLAYDQLHLHHNFSVKFPNPMNIAIYKNFTSETLPPQFYIKSNVSCPNQSPTTSKWGPLMRYNHFFFKQYELSDASPGSTEHYTERFENRIINLGSKSFIAYFQYFGGLHGGLRGSIDLNVLQKFGLDGKQPDKDSNVCEAGTNRPHAWKLDFAAFLNTTVSYRPTHLVFHVGFWFQPNIWSNDVIEAYAVAGARYAKVTGAKLYWKTHPLPSKTEFPWITRLNDATKVFLAHGWKLYDAAKIAKRNNFTFPDRIHLELKSNTILTQEFMKNIICVDENEDKNK